jgi:hypothetical protein
MAEIDDAPVGFHGVIRKSTKPIKSTRKTVSEGCRVQTAAKRTVSPGAGRAAAAYGQQETDENRQHLHRDAGIAPEPLNLPYQPVETAREGRFAAISAVRNKNDMTAVPMIAG